jgi:hypothetical protein
MWTAQSAMKCPLLVSMSRLILMSVLSTLFGRDLNLLIEGQFKCSEFICRLINEDNLLVSSVPLLPKNK